MRTYKVDVSLNGHELKSFKVEKLSTNPTLVSGDEARVWYNTTSKDLWYWDGTTSYSLAKGTSIANAVIKASNASAVGVLQVSNATDKTIKDYAGGVGIVKTDASGIASAAVAGTDYVTPTGAATLTNKTLSAASNTISNLQVSHFAAGIVKTSITATGEDDTHLPTTKAVADFVANRNFDNIEYRPSVDLIYSNAGVALPATTATQIDGVTVTDNMRVLVLASLTGTQVAKIYKATVVSTTISWAVQQDQTGADAPADGHTTWVKGGTTYGDTRWTFNSTVWVQTSGSGSIPDASTSVAGKTMYATPTETRTWATGSKAVTPSGLVNFPKLYSNTFDNSASWIGSGPFTITIASATHGCSTGNKVGIWVYDDTSAPGSLVTDCVDITVSATGDVVITTLEKFAGHYVIIGTN